MNNTYAEFLLQLIEQLFAEDEIKGLASRTCYICNTLNHPMITSVIPSPYSWTEHNAQYITMLLNSIDSLLNKEHKAQMQFARETYNNYMPTKPTTLTMILEKRYPNTTPLGRRVEWLQDLAKYHKARGTSRTCHEIRGWLKVAK